MIGLGYNYLAKRYNNWAFNCVLIELFALSFSYEVATGALVVGWLCYLYKSWKWGWHWQKSVFDIPILLFAVFGLLSVSVAPEPSFSFYNFWNLVGRYLLTYYLVVQTYPRDDFNATNKVIFVLLLSFFIVVIYGLLQGLLGLGVQEQGAWVDQGVFANLTTRVYSTWYNPNLFGGYLDILLGVVAGLFICSKQREYKWILAALFIMGLGVLTMTYARGALLAIVLTLGLYTGLKQRKIFLGLLLLLVIVALLNPLLVERFVFTTQKLDTSSEMRLAFWTSTWAMIKAHPLLGIGWGEFYQVYPQYDYYMQGNYIKIVHAHNLFLNIWAEIGIFGLLSYVTAFGLGIYKGFKGINFRNSNVKGLALGCALGILAIAFNGFTDFVLFNVELSMLAWFLLAVLTVLARRGRMI